MSERLQSETMGPTLLPSDIAPSEDLTWLMRQAAGACDSPFDGVHLYSDIFESISRVLVRRQFPHVFLVGEPGVGKMLLVADLARRSAVEHRRCTGGDWSGPGKKVGRGVY